jgi:signal transduction histidine kinase
MTDARRLEQALTGLLLTSIRYTEVGEIRVTCYLREPDVVLTVADDGVGFTTEEQARIFEPFLSVASRGGRSFPGTGLSLTACHRLMAALEGKIRVESEVDRGSWFTLTIPMGS